ncbi:MAG: translocation/assembly module TamB domain-containing protein [Nitrospirota bacterium]
MRRALRITCLTLLGLLVLLLGALWYAVSTERALTWAYGELQARVPGELRVQSLKGTLKGPIKVSGLRYGSPTMNMRLESLSLDWNLWSLLFLTLHVENVQARGLHVELAGKEAPGKPSALPALRLPLAVSVSDLRVTDVSILRPGGREPLVVREFYLKAKLGRKLTIKDLRLKAPLLDARVRGSLTPSGDYPLDLTLHWTARPPGYAEASGSGTLKGSVTDMDIAQRLTAPFEGSVQATVRDALTRLRWEGTVSMEGLDPKAVNPRWPEEHISGDVRGSGTLASFSLSGALRAREAVQGRDVTADFALKREDGLWSIKKLTALFPGLQTRVQVHGEVLTHPVRADLTGSWRSLAWPPGAERPLIASPSGTLVFIGEPDAYSFEFHGDLSGKDIPRGQWDLTGKGNASGVEVSALKARVLDGVVTGSGRFGWKPATTWKASLSAKGVNPEGLAEQWKGKLAVAVETTGTLGKEGRSMAFDLKKASGTLRGYPLRASGRLEVKGDSYSLSRLTLRSGLARLTASGGLDESWNMHWEMDAQELKALLPGAAGSLSGKGRLRGPRRKPIVQATLKGTEVRYGEYRAQSLSAKLTLDLTSTGESKVDVDAQGLTLRETKLQRLAVRGSGTIASHRFDADMTAKDAALSLSAKGGYQKGSWRGTLGKAELVSPEFGTWNLESPAALAVSSGAVQAEVSCWASKKARACAGGSWKKERGWRGKASLEALPVGLLGPFLPEKTALTGTLGGRADLAGGPGRPTTGSFSFTMRDGSFSYAMEEQSLGFPLPKAEVQGTLTEKAASARWDISLGKDGTLSGKVSLPPLEGTTIPDGPLKGTLRAELRELGFLGILTTKVRDVEGALTADLALSGRTKNPEVSGTLRVTGAKAAIPPLGITLSKIDLTATMKGDNVISFEGGAASGEGTVEIKGSLEAPPGKPLSLQVELTGKQFEAIRVPEARILISPDMEIRLKGKTIRLEGKLAIPEADIKPRDLSGAVEPSPDVVVVRKAGRPGKRAQQWKLFAEVTVVLGDKVHFEAFGLEASLAGSLAVVDQPGKATTGQGELTIVEGHYRAYGQDLTIKDGRIIFVGGPVDNPRLDIRAVRQVKDVTAGIQVTGNLRSPRLTVFSDPPMEEADALSYVLFGRPLRGISSSEGRQLYGAATSAALAGGEVIAERVGHLFGIQEVEIESGQTREQATLFLGRYLSPSLYVSYGVGIFEPINVFRMRYMLTGNWSLQAESGTESGVDLFYNIER